ncbi:NPL4 family-domain-containing protein [Entophlyctis helioformis]|nr:NPL4 family-domain-containing protein [Entophlyctis helioformis]
MEHCEPKLHTRRLDMLLRIRSPTGQTRVTVDAASTDAAGLKAQVARAIGLHHPDSQPFVLARDPAGASPLSALPGLPLASLGLLPLGLSCCPSAPSATATPLSPLLVKQDPLDNHLEKLDGTIKRGRDARFCKHGSAGMCEYCLPLQPYDAAFLDENKIKHMSFHAYLRLLTQQNKTAPVSSPAFVHPLDVLDFKVKAPCPSKAHAPFPQGICTKCQPSAITLQSQSFRMVDHIEFESPAIIDAFIQFWRATGSQRAGILYGRYVPYSEVPLGVKAVVSAIYEPPQHATHDSIQLDLPDPAEASVDAMAAALGLVRVGIVYTDLTDDGSGTGTVVCKRHADSYFLSSAECLFASEFQSRYPVASKYSPTGTFGSRFVTCVISGNNDGGIDIFSYQVSETCVAMARDSVIEATTDPSLVRVCESTDKQYVPEVFYKYKNEYNIMVKNAAKPTFPVEYLLVTVSHGFPSSPSPFFKNSRGFPVENRMGIDKPRDMAALKNLLNGAQPMDALSDFHALLFISEAGILDSDDLRLLTEYVKTGSEAHFAELSQRGSWQTLMMILQETSTTSATPGGMDGGSGSGSGGAPARSAAPVACRHCTYVNGPGIDTCEMCGLPLDQ